MRPHKSIETEFPTSTEGLPDAQPVKRRQLVHGDEVTLEIAPVKKEIGGAVVRMLAYNGSVPGPTLELRRAPRSPSRSRTTATSTPPCTGTASVLRTVSTERMRRSRRFPSGNVHLPDCPSPIQASTGTTRTSARTTARRWVSTGTSSSSRRSRLLASSRSGAPTHARRHPHRGRQGRAFSASETTHVAMGRFGNVMLVSGERSSHSTRGAERSYASTSRIRPTLASSTWRCPARA